MKVHVGCGKVFIPNFIHIDIARFSHIDYVAAFDKLPFFNNSVDLIYCCHALTYYDRYEIPNIMKEWCRVLKPGGIARISVTDFRAVAIIYQLSDADISKVIGPIFGRWEVADQIIYHKTIFDIGSFEQLADKTGFSKTQLWDWRTTEHSHIDDYSQAYYPHMDKANGTPVSLNMEAIK